MSPSPIEIENITAHLIHLGYFFGGIMVGIAIAYAVAMFRHIDVHHGEHTRENTRRPPPAVE